MIKNKIKYNKLVRDRIPEIIKSKGINCGFHVLNDVNEYRDKLYEKLIEEFNEFKEKPSVEELGDMLEVLESISKFYALNLVEVNEKKESKKKKCGGFDEKIILDYTD